MISPLKPIGRGPPVEHQPTHYPYNRNWRTPLVKTKAFITATVAVGLVFAPTAAIADDSTTTDQSTAASTAPASPGGCETAPQSDLSPLELLIRADASELDNAQAGKSAVAATDCTTSPPPITGHDVVLPVEPTDPVGPHQPIEPIEPVDPVDPVEPTDPVAPVDPVDPVAPPVEPVDPVDPVAPPAGPEIPVGPEIPAGPETPIQQPGGVGVPVYDWGQGPSVGEAQYQQVAGQPGTLAVTGANEAGGFLAGAAAALLAGAGFVMFGRRRRGAGTDAGVVEA